MLKFSTHEELFENEGLKKKSAKSGISYGTLKKVYNRGMAAWKTGHRPGTTPQQWAMARVNSYIGKGKGTYYGADSDLSGKGKKESVDEAKYDYFDSKDAADAHAKKHGGEVYKNSGKGATMVKGKPSNTHVVIKGKMFENRVDETRITSTAFRARTSMVNPMDKKNISDMAKDKKYKGNTSALMRDVKKKYPDQHKSDIVQNIYKKHAETNEATVKEISKNLAKNYIGKASRDVFDKGRADATQDAIGKLGGKHKDQDYNKGPERKASMRVRGIDRATNRLMKKEAMSDAEKKAHDAAIAAFKMKGGKIKKLPPGYADGYHGKADPGAGIKGMISKADTKDFGTKKKVRSMK